MDVVFAVAPFAELRSPSIGVSQLKAEIARRGFSAAIEYCNIDLAEQIGTELYFHLFELRMVRDIVVKREHLEILLGEWFFADVLFGSRLPPAEEYISRFVGDEPLLRDVIPEILRARERVHEFVEASSRKILAREPSVVGFTTTFQQTCASLALARELKKAPKPPLVIFGGANCESEMGLQLLRSFPWVDYVCCGEGDVVFPEFLDRLLRDGKTTAIPGILKQGESTRTTAAPMVQNLNDLAYPDYSDYLDRLASSPLKEEIDAPWLLMESARGCWWGAKQHCTFCGLNGESMAFRSKSSARTIEEIHHLVAAYGIRHIECVDNILDMRYFQTVLPDLAESGLGLELFYETKANLKYDQVQMLQKAGVKGIQPGIESLSNEVLKLMRKGCTALQNIQLMRWCDEVGLTLTWNLIIGFPGESASEYADMADLIPLLTHLQPPGYCGRIRLDRFSPYFANPAGFGIHGIRPLAAYRYIFPLSPDEIHRLAYFFDFDYGDARDPYSYSERLLGEAKLWGELFNSSTEEKIVQLDLLTAGNLLLISDTRPCAVKPLHVIGGLAAEVYLLCDSAQTPASLRREVDAEDASIRCALDDLIEAKLMVQLDGQYLSLAVFRNRKTNELEDITDRELKLPRRPVAESVGGLNGSESL